jgi:hypothetical protein
MVLWGIAAVALLLAGAAWHRAGRLARKHEALNQSYWELRYDFTRLRSQVARLDPETAEADAPPAAPPGPGDGQVTFVPLTSMKKKG